MFANDLLLFTRASKGQVEVMRGVLAKFCKALGMKVNVAKSRGMGHMHMRRIG